MAQIYVSLEMYDGISLREGDPTRNLHKFKIFQVGIIE